MREELTPAVVEKESLDNSEWIVHESRDSTFSQGSNRKRIVPALEAQAVQIEEVKEYLDVKDESLNANAPLE